MNDSNRQTEHEGCEWFTIVFGSALIVSLMFGATFCHAKASRAQAHDVMPVLQRDTVFLPQAMKGFTP